MNPDLETFLKAAIGVGLVTLVFVALTSLVGCGGRCESSSCIEIEDEPTCVDLVTDECVPEVIEEFCPEPTECTECEEPTSFEAICKRLPYGIRKKQPECAEHCHGKEHRW